MSNVKKAFQPVVEFLQENKDSKVKTVLDDVIEMCKAKSAGGVATASHRDENGDVVAIRCNYYGLWFPTSHVAFGRKEGSNTGFNSMCKEGANNFSKQQRQYKQARENLLDQVAAGELKPEQIPAEQEKLEAARKEPIPFSVPGMGWESLEDCLAQSTEDLDALVEQAEAERAEAEAEAEANAENAEA